MRKLAKRGNDSLTATREQVTTGFDPDAHLLTRTLEITYSAKIFSTPSHSCLQEALILAEDIQVYK